MRKLFARIWIPFACVGVMLITSLCLIAFYLTVLFRKLFIKDFVTNAQKQSAEAEAKKMKDAKVGSASSQMNALARKFEKGSQSAPDANTI